MSTTTTAPAPVIADSPGAVHYGSGPDISVKGVACDGCPTARAKARVVMPAGELYLCGHHLREGLDVIMASALSVTADVPEGSYWMPEEKR